MIATTFTSPKTSRKPEGILVTSLDFELAWGVCDCLEGYEENIYGVRKAIPAILDLFDEFDIHATWAVVGFLYFESKNEMLKNLPLHKPNYVNKRLSTYDYISSIGNDENSDPLHFGKSLIDQILKHKNQEIASHTFSHYYCLEKNQNIETFKEDLIAAIDVAKKHGNPVKSLVLPRNQVNYNYLQICQELGITTYRGNEPYWFYAARESGQESPLIRAFRLIDSYVPLTGKNTYSINVVDEKELVDIPSSRFLRPYSSKLKILQPLKLKRITSGIQKAAKLRQLYHLWWHPHNFGINLKENINFLRNILEYTSYMQNHYRLKSCSMGEATALLKEKM